MDSRGDDKGTTKGRREGVNELDFFPPYFFIYIFLAAENYTVGEDRGRLYDTLPPLFFSSLSWSPHYRHHFPLRAFRPLPYTLSRFSLSLFLTLVKIAVISDYYYCTFIFRGVVRINSCLFCHYGLLFFALHVFALLGEPSADYGVRWLIAV